jgi:hypothetical protein
MSNTTAKIWCSRGQVEVSIGDAFYWNGIGKGNYTVVGWGSKLVYSPSGLGGAPTVFVRNEETQVCEEWCGDSVAAGIHETIAKITP